MRILASEQYEGAHTVELDVRRVIFDDENMRGPGGQMMRRNPNHPDRWIPLTYSRATAKLLTERSPNLVSALFSHGHRAFATESARLTEAM